MSRKLLYIQLQKAGVPMDPWTLAEVFDIPNFGRPPEGANTVYERWVASERIKGELQAHIQAKGAEIMGNEQIQQAVKQAMAQQAVQGPPQQGPPGAPPQGGSPQPGGAPQGGSPPAQPGQGNLPQPSYSPALGHNGPGRPAEMSGGTPVIESKEGGVRSTITNKK